ncbi:MAG: DUF962 domain-containing protein [Candidatus Obscuribacterales bacterium]|nr:DUF962 domain-containing protein [Candidatus Obscuribacterales bacterium]
MEMNKRRLKTLTEALAFYKTRHRSPGCKITHMIGIPLLILAPFVFLFDKRNGCLFGITGTFFQLIGHFLFEKNMPTIVETRDPMIIPASIIFTIDEWADVFEGRWIANNGTDLFAKGKIKSSIEPEHSKTETDNSEAAALPIYIHSSEVQ